MSALSNETYSFFINLIKVADDKDFYVDENWSNANISNIFAALNFSNLYMDNYSCHAECKWKYNHRCNYMIIDGNTCYFACNTHLSGLKNASVEFSENASLVKSNGKVRYLSISILTFSCFIFQNLNLLLNCVLSK